MWRGFLRHLHEIERILSGKTFSGIKCVKKTSDSFFFLYVNNCRAMGSY